MQDHTTDHALASTIADRGAQRQDGADPLPFRLGLAMAASALILMVLMTAAGLRVSSWQLSELPLYALVGAALAVRLGLGGAATGLRGKLAEGAEYLLVFIAIALMGVVASYPIAALSTGYTDAALNRIDVAMGFDWVAWYREVSSYRSLQLVGTLLYRSIYFTPALLIGWFAAKGDRAGAYHFLATFWLAAVVTLAGFALLPAVGPFSYLWHAPITYMPDSESWQAGLIPALRAHDIHTVELSHLHGLVSAPSFHAAAATIYIATAWRLGVLRWPLLALNVAMLVATPVEGTHYLIDLPLGIASACAALWAVGRFGHAPRGGGRRRPARRGPIAQRP